MYLELMYNIYLYVIRQYINIYKYIKLKYIYIEHSFWVLKSKGKLGAWNVVYGAISETFEV